MLTIVGSEKLKIVSLGNSLSCFYSALQSLPSASIRYLFVTVSADSFSATESMIESSTTPCSSQVKKKTFPFLPVNRHWFELLASLASFFFIIFPTCSVSQHSY